MFLGVQSKRIDNVVYLISGFLSSRMQSVFTLAWRVYWIAGISHQQVISPFWQKFLRDCTQRRTASGRVEKWCSAIRSIVMVVYPLLRFQALQRMEFCQDDVTMGVNLEVNYTSTRPNMDHQKALNLLLWDLLVYCQIRSIPQLWLQLEAWRYCCKSINHPSV